MIERSQHLHMDGYKPLDLNSHLNTLNLNITFQPINPLGKNCLNGTIQVFECIPINWCMLFSRSLLYKSV